MANSKGRRKLRRKLPETEVSTPPPTLSRPHEPRRSNPSWKRIPGWVYGIVVVSSIIVTVLEGYPWLSIQRDDSLNSSNPYATVFLISNEGYIPITDLDAYCIPDYGGTKTFAMHDNTLRYSDFASWLGHASKVTVPCFRIFTVDSHLGNIESPKLTISITYAFLHANINSLRRQQTFQFKAVKAEDASWHWTYVH
jgi:hypothetical protein